MLRLLKAVVRRLADIILQKYNRNTWEPLDDHDDVEMNQLNE